MSNPHLQTETRIERLFSSVTFFDIFHKMSQNYIFGGHAKHVHVCIPGHECCSHFIQSFRNAGKGTRSPVSGTVVLSLSGHPLGSSLEIAKAPGPADVSRLGLRISTEPDILAKNLADMFCQNVQTDTLAASKQVML